MQRAANKDNDSPPKTTTCSAFAEAKRESPAPVSPAESGAVTPTGSATVTGTLAATDATVHVVRKCSGVTPQDSPL